MDDNPQQGPRGGREIRGDKRKEETVVLSSENVADMVAQARAEVPPPAPAPAAPPETPPAAPAPPSAASRVMEGAGNRNTTLFIALGIVAVLVIGVLIALLA